MERGVFRSRPVLEAFSLALALDIIVASWQVLGVVLWCGWALLSTRVFREDDPKA